MKEPEGVSNQVVVLLTVLALYLEICLVFSDTISFWISDTFIKFESDISLLSLYINENDQDQNI